MFIYIYIIIHFYIRLCLYIYLLLFIFISIFNNIYVIFYFYSKYIYICLFIFIYIFICIFFLLIFILIFLYIIYRFTVLLVFYEILYAISDMLLVLLLILLAKGWTIVNKVISRHGRLKITLYSTVYWWISILTILWRELSYKLWERGVLYRNTAGIFLIVVRALITLWFVYALYVTMKKITKKLHFYYKFGFCGLCWFIINFCIYIYICLFIIFVNIFY